MVTGPMPVGAGPAGGWGCSPWGGGVGWFGGRGVWVGEGGCCGFCSGGCVLSSRGLPGGGGSVVGLVGVWSGCVV